MVTLNNERPLPLVTSLSNLLLLGLVKEQIKRFSFVLWHHVKTWFKSLMTLWIGTPHQKSPLCQVWCFIFCHVASRDHIIKETGSLLSGSRSTNVPTVLSLMLIGFKKVEYKTYITRIQRVFRYMTLHEHIIKETCDLVKGNPSARSMLILLVEDTIYYLYYL